ncbi:PQQ-binding-like beta-propeller repeat protein [Cellulomonas sp. McL0617]|uniref:outer membrane protein assembly factor BamB family protein n=1 Tax=Cellulomonas sp. McL0617 TaxID=3415675 RepID=UPI003CEC06A9
MTRHAMQDVELEDARPAVAPVAGPRRPRVRWWWFGAVAVVAAVALVGAQGVLDGRERAAAARYAAVPGVVAPVGPGVRVVWRPPDALAGLVLGGVVSDGELVGLEVADDGSQAVLALDQRTGHVTWSRSMFGPDPSRALSLDRPVAGRCARAAEHEVACLVSNGFQHVDRAGSPAVVPATITRVVVLDTRDGRVLADHAAPRATSMAVLPGLVALSAPGQGVTGQDLLTGAELWRYVPRSAGADLSEAAFTSAVQVFAAGDVVGVTNPGWSVALLDASGNVVRTPIPAIAGYRYDATTGVLALLSTTQSGQVRSTLVRSGRRDVDLAGNYLDVVVDDGSVPDLALTSDSSVRGWDTSTGRVRWTTNETATGSALILRGRVYVPTMTGTVAFDGRTGAVVWRTTVTPGHVPGSLSTDGSSILVADQPVAGQERSELLAYGVDDGRLLWQAPLPAGIRSSTSVGRVLLGLTTDGVAVLG